MSRKKIYISGKMGEKVLSQETIEKFARAEEQLRTKGCDCVHNPACESFQEALHDYLAYGNNGENKDAAILLFDMGCIARCDAIYMLRDWKESPGARAEYYYAKAIGLEIIHEDESYT